MVPVTSCFYLLVNCFYFWDNLNRFDMFPRIRARMNPLSRQEPGPTSSVTREALYSETVPGYTFSPRIRTGIAAGPNLQLTGLGFTRNLLLKKVSPEPAHKPGDTVRTAVHREWCVLHSRAVHIARHSQLYICGDAGCTYVLTEFDK